MDGPRALPATDADQLSESGDEATEMDSSTAAGIKSWVREILGWIVKLLPVIATVLVAFIADGYKTSLTASTLLSEREKADSQLRSEMFAKLVDPISGARAGSQVSLEREQLLAELLSLNFHEHIGLKPLLSYVDTRLARESMSIDEAKANTARTARQSFRSVARTVISRQTAMLTRSGGESSNDSSAQIQKLDIGMPINNCTSARFNFGEPFLIENPMGTHWLYLTVSRPTNWDSEIFHVDVSIHAVRSGEEVELAKQDFELSWFDFPLTDNTLLGDGTRFAIVLDQIYNTNGRFNDDEPEQTTSDATRRVKLNIVWFPKDYIAARERPTNYREFRRSLRLDER
jgi:hypothetical protein